MASGREHSHRVVMTSNKVGHDYPTGPLDMIQSWVELRVKDASGQRSLSRGSATAGTFFRPGLFSSRPSRWISTAI